MSASEKENGRCFEDFEVGMILRHPSGTHRHHRGQHLVHINYSKFQSDSFRLQLLSANGIRQAARKFNVYPRGGHRPLSR